MGVRTEGNENRTLDITCIVLAGGKGLRFGGGKLRETVGESNLLQRVLSQLTAFNSDIIIVTAGDSSLPPVDGYQGCRIASDIYPGKGVLGGIYTGLVESSSPYNIVVACDMPFLNQALLRYMAGLAAGFELVVPRLGELVEPLHAVYARSCLAPIERLLKQDIMEVRALFDMVKVRYVDAAEIDRFDPQHLSFFNVNTADDLEKARKMLLRGVER
jgi:molybdopterin-guanine dinucleotide biosynthesis protein A